MPSYKAPVEDTIFLLRDVLGYERHGNLPGFADAPIDLVETVLGEAGKLAEEIFQPLNRVGDLEGCKRHDDGRVTTPKGFKEAHDAFGQGGWIGLSAPAEFGGQGLPATLTSAMAEYLSAANLALA